MTPGHGGLRHLIGCDLGIRKIAHGAVIPSDTATVREVTHPRTTAVLGRTRGRRDLDVRRTLQFCQGTASKGGSAGGLSGRHWLRHVADGRHLARMKFPNDRVLGEHGVGELFRILCSTLGGIHHLGHDALAPHGQVFVVDSTSQLTRILTERRRVGSLVMLEV